MGASKALGEEPGLEDLAKAMSAGVDMVKKRGRSNVGEKTMLDVLVPVSEMLSRGVAAGLDVAELLPKLVSTAESNLEATKALKATKGRASYLGERSIGHLDPGATSSCIMIRAACHCVEGRS